MILALSRTRRATTAAAAARTPASSASRRCRARTACCRCRRGRPRCPRAGCRAPGPRSGRTSSRGPGPASAREMRSTRLAGRVHAQLAAVGHAEAEDVHVLARAGADALGEEREADAHQLAARARFSACSAPQLVVAGDAHRLLQRPRVVAGVVLPAGRRGVRELLGPQQVLHPQLGRVHAPARRRGSRPSARRGTPPR